MKRHIKLYEDVGDDIGFVELYQHSGSDQTIIDAARVSYGQDTDDEERWRPEADPKLLRYLIKNQHWSPLEHCHVTWIVQVPLFVRSQWHRHRVWSFNELSRRYTSAGIEFYEPNHFRAQASQSKQASDWKVPINPETDGGNTYSEALRDHALNSVYLYESMLEAGIAREQARMVLPQNLYTRFYATVNLRNALAFIQLREDNHAQLEIYVAAAAMRQHLEHLFPETVQAWSDVISTRKEG